MGQLPHSDLFTFHAIIDTVAACHGGTTPVAAHPGGNYPCSSTSWWLLAMGGTTPCSITSWWLLATGELPL